jgi:SAM-dependent methyltransferase
MRPYVQKDSRILDCGCGPGSITVGLAEWAFQGEVIGVDTAEESLQVARDLARKHHLPNVEFREGDLFELPFANSSFDVVFSSAVLCHVQRPDKAISEMKRVLRPNGYLAIRDVIVDAAVFYPQDDLLRDFFRVIGLGMSHTGGNPNIGRELGVFLSETGFGDVLLTVGTNQPSSFEERSEFYPTVAKLLAGDLATIAINEGWITDSRLQQVVARVRAVADEPGSISVLTYGEAIGRKIP